MQEFYYKKESEFRGRVVPENGYLVGYAHLVKLLEEEYPGIPLPQKISLVTQGSRRYSQHFWEIYSKTYLPEGDFISQVKFAIRYEGLDLYILKRVFETFGEKPILKMVQKEPTSKYTRRIWFLYEWLMEKELKIPNLNQGTYVDLVNPELQFTGPAENSTRHRLRNNLPGSRNFCPMIYRTEKLNRFLLEDFPGQIEEGLSTSSKDLLRRAAAFLLLKDSKASFAIEGEFPNVARTRNWGKVIGQAGKRPLTVKEFERLQNVLMGNQKLKHMGVRQGEGFIGVHDRDTFLPIPDHISAKASDLPELLEGLLSTHLKLQQSDYHPVLVAAIIAFGFVFIHPFSDGNGRIHRYLIHHILIEKGYTSRDMIFPVSAAILERISDYQEVLEAYSGPRLELMKWEETADHNIEVINETIDLYRYYDLTKQAEFLFECVEDTVDRIIPEEIDYLRKYDQLYRTIDSKVNLPNHRVDLLIKFLHQNDGKLSNKKRSRYFDEINEEDLQKFENSYREIFVLSKS